MIKNRSIRKGDEDRELNAGSASHNYIIEFDGRQHYLYDNSGWNSKENFLKTKQRDQLRNDYCKSKGIPLIRIPYTDINSIQIKDLIPQTSSYLI